MATAILFILLVIAVVFGVKSYRKRLTTGCCGSAGQPSVKKLKVADRNISHYPYHKILKVDGMTCGSCAARVENALNGLDGVWARVDLLKGEVDLRMKMEYDDGSLRSAVKDAGYTVYGIRDGGE